MAGKKAAITNEDIQNPLYVELEEGARTTRPTKGKKLAKTATKVTPAVRWR